MDLMRVGLWELYDFCQISYFFTIEILVNVWRRYYTEIFKDAIWSLDGRRGSHLLF